MKANTNIFYNFIIDNYLNFRKWLNFKKQSNKKYQF